MGQYDEWRGEVERIDCAGDFTTLRVRVFTLTNDRFTGGSVVVLTRSRWEHLIQTERAYRDLTADRSVAESPKEFVEGMTQ